MISANEVRRKIKPENLAKPLFKTDKKREKYIRELLRVVSFQIWWARIMREREAFVTFILDVPFININKLKNVIKDVQKRIEEHGYNVYEYGCSLTIKW